MADFRKIVDMPGNALLIDVREPGEYAAGHIPGTIISPAACSNSKSGNRSASARRCICNARVATARLSLRKPLRIWALPTSRPW
jgi:rhodanese-related sulfurtransferase